MVAQRGFTWQSAQDAKRDLTDGSLHIQQQGLRRRPGRLAYAHNISSGEVMDGGQT